ncbi:MAG: hypothetical protein K0S04_2578 [Herbinix sp.]|jgi:shikimate dehydrogenase|nr:hypothetical protein [Herbinix sp.]
MRYGLIGEKLGHSYSKVIHEKLADYTYDLIPLSKDEFGTFMEKKEFTAINVTIPYKQEVIPYLDELDPLAMEIGAVNTIVNRNGHYVGYNTDFYGFKYMLLHNNIQIKGKKCLVLGNGGTSQTVQAVLKHLDAGEIFVVSRRGSDDGSSDSSINNSRDTISEMPDSVNRISYEACYAEHTDAAIIVNTTPLGMYPNLEGSPLDLTAFTKCEAVVDVIFNPLKTKIAIQAEAMGIKAVTGLEMLVAQAKQAIEYFLDKALDDALIDQVYQELFDELQKNNL